MKLFISISILLFCSCKTKPIDQQKTNNPGIDVELLFENDGCKVYRFYDSGRNHYYTDCSGQTISHYRSGKTTIQEETSTFNSNK